jgi:hypothetical protein
MEALRSLDQRGVTPATFALREPSLDDVFLALTGRRAEEDELGDNPNPFDDPLLAATETGGQQ